MKHNSNKKQWVWFKGLHLDCFITTAAFCRRSNINAKTAATPNNNLEIRAAVSLHSPTAPHYRSIDEMTFFLKSQLTAGHYKLNLLDLKGNSGHQLNVFIFRMLMFEYIAITKITDKHHHC